MKKELAKFEGKWTVVKIEINGVFFLEKVRHLGRERKVKQRKAKILLQEIETMKWELVALAGTFSLALAGAFADDRKDDKTLATREKLTGVWVAQGGQSPAGSTFELTKDGRFKSILKIGGSEIRHEGVYKLDGDTITATHKRADGSERVRILKILKLNDSDLTVSDEDEKTTLKKKTK